MPNRLVPQEMLNEDWFIELAGEYKMLFLWVWINASQDGIWRPKIAYFRQIVGKMIFIDNFLRDVNKECEEGKERIRVLKNKNWFLRGWQPGKSYLAEQLGPVFKPNFNAHKGALSNLARNGINLSEIEGFDWLGMERLDIQEVIFLGNQQRISLQDIHSALSNNLQGIVNEEIGNRNKEIGNRKEGGVGETKDEKTESSLWYKIPDWCKVKVSAGPNPITMNVQELYELDWDMFASIPKSYKGIVEESFQDWKKFVDFLVKNDDQKFTDLFNYHSFISPYDMQKLTVERQFREAIWEKTVLKLVRASKGIVPTGNMYHRLCDYIRYANSPNGVKKETLNAGEPDYSKMEK